MSTSEQEMPIEEVLESLVMEIANDFVANDNNKVSDLEPSRAIEAAEKAVEKLGIRTLRETHVRVMISFQQMLDYIDKVRKPMKTGDIKELLQIYMDMARSYYTQYERSLVQDIQKQYKTQKESQAAVRRIEALQDPDLKPVIEPLNKVGVTAAAEYAKLLESFPALLQNALDKLRDEWQRLGSIAVASEALTEDGDLIGFLDAVVNVAAHSIGIEAERIVVVPGREFALYFFTYVDNFAVLTVPIYSVQAPWEWSIFWHELAGYKVRHLVNNTTLTTIRKNLIERQKLLAKITWDWENPFSRDYLQKSFSDDEPDLSDFGGFEHQFERMLAHLPKTDKLKMYQNIKDQGWSVEWFEELFEDAWSVLAIEVEFLPFFEDVLRRHAAKDDRHPPMDVRIQVAKELLNLMHPEWNPKFPSKTPEATAAQQILKFISLLIAGTRKFETDGDDVLQLQKLRDGLFIGMREEIQGVIRDWSNGFPERGEQNRQYVSTEDTADRARKYAEEFIKLFSSADAAEGVAQLLSAFANYNEKNQIKPSTEFFDALKAKDYKQLINLSFYDVDFGFPASRIKNIRFGNSIKNITKKVFTTIANTINIVLDGSSKILGSGGDNDITYDGPDGTTYHAPRQNWNTAFESQSQYQLP